MKTKAQVMGKRMDRMMKHIQKSQRDDGWKNVLTGLGIRGRDKRMSALPDYTLLDQGIVEALYQSDDTASKIIDRLPEEMMREGFEIKIIDGDQDLAEKAMDELKRHGVEDKAEEALKYSRLYGSSLIVFGIDGLSPDEPLDLARVRKIKYFIVVDKNRLSPEGYFNQDLDNPNFGYPEYYTLNTANGRASTVRVHHSQIIRFDGVKLPYNLMLQNGGWGDTVLSRLFNVIRNYNSSHDSAATIVQDFAQAIFKLKGLSEMLASGDDNLVTKRLELLSLMSSIVNAIVVEEGEEYERKTTSVAGLSDLLKTVGNRLVSATDMPHTLILGESPGASLGEGGQSEKNDWYDHVRNKQESILRSPLTRILDLIFAEKTGISGGKIPKYTIEFRPLKQMNEKDQATNRKTMAEADAVYLDRGVVSPDEVAESRFGGDGFSVDTTLDWKARKEIDIGRGKGFAKKGEGEEEEGEKEE